MKKQFLHILLLALLTISCKKAEVLPVDLRAEMVNREFIGEFELGKEKYQNTSANFNRGGIRDPYYIANLHFEDNDASGLIEIMENGTFGINLQIDGETYSGSGSMVKLTVKFSAKSQNGVSVKFEGDRVVD